MSPELISAGADGPSVEDLPRSLAPNAWSPWEHVPTEHSPMLPDTMKRLHRRLCDDAALLIRANEARAHKGMPMRTSWTERSASAPWGALNATLHTLDGSWVGYTVTWRLVIPKPGHTVDELQRGYKNRPIWPFITPIASLTVAVGIPLIYGSGLLTTLLAVAAFMVFFISAWAGLTLDLDPMPKQVRAVSQQIQLDNLSGPQGQAAAALLQLAAGPMHQAALETIANLQEDPDADHATAAARLAEAIASVLEAAEGTDVEADVISMCADVLTLIPHELSVAEQTITQLHDLTGLLTERSRELGRTDQDDPMRAQAHLDHVITPAVEDITRHLNAGDERS